MHARAADIMSRTVYTVRPSDSLTRVIALLCRHRISGVPVVERQRRLVGLVSERDVLEAMYPDHPELRQGRTRLPLTSRVRRLGQIPVREVMVRDVVVAAPDTDILRLASLMAVNKIRRVPILDDGRLVGIVSQGDVYQAIFERKGSAGSR